MASAGTAPSRSDLTPSQKRVLRLMLDGKSNREIAGETRRTVHAIEVTVYEICQFFGVRGVRGLLGKYDQAVKILESGNKTENLN